MKKKALFFFCLLLLAGCETMQTTVKPPENVDLPKNIKFLAQSCTADSLFQSVIDLANNELVVLEYTADILYRIYRTGIFLNPADYAVHKGMDAPFPDNNPGIAEEEQSNAAAGSSS